MRFVAVLVALIVAAPVVLAARPTIAGTASGLALALPTIPVSLSQGATRTAIIGANNTSSRDAITGGLTSSAVINSTALRNNGIASIDYQVRLVYTSMSGTVAECAKCDLQLRNASAATPEITVETVAPAAGTPGPWVTLKSGENAWIWVIANANLLASTTNTMHYTLEIQPLPLPTAGTPIDAQYVNMSVVFTV